MKRFYIFFSWWQLILFDGLMVAIAWFLAHWSVLPLTHLSQVLAILPLVVLIQVGALIVCRVYRVPWEIPSAMSNNSEKPTGSWGRFGKFNRKFLPGMLVGAFLGFMMGGPLLAFLFGVLGYYSHSKLFTSTRDIVVITTSVFCGAAVIGLMLYLFRVPLISGSALLLHAVLLIGLLMTNRLLYRAYQTRKK